MKPVSASKSYFNMFHELFGKEKAGTKCVALLKIISLATLIIPAIFVSMLICEKLSNRNVKRFNHKDFPELNHFAKNLLNKQKAHAFDDGMRAFEKMKLQNTLGVARLADETAFEQSKTKLPAYFDASFANNNMDVEEDENNRHEFRLISASRQFGKNCFTPNDFGGKEDLCAAEIPTIAQYLATNVAMTRSEGKGNGRVLRASPKPIAFMNAQRVQEVIAFENTMGNMEYKGSVLDKPQTLNLLGINTPALKNKNLAEQQTSVETMSDVFNSLVAAFTLAKEQTPEGKTCHIKGAFIGCGAYNHDPKVMCVLQYLAAEYVDVSIDLPNDIENASNHQEGVNHLVNGLLSATICSELADFLDEEEPKVRECIQRAHELLAAA